ncbi:MAG: PAS domain S-box protein [Proteobacteria bacterium]|nr:PAS domain S-box protein [Pseudomonadota bacterium]
MSDKDKTKEQLVNELAEARQRIVELEKSEIECKRVKRALRESERKFLQIIDGSSIPAFVVGKKHTVTHCNKAFEKLTGISASKIIGTTNQWLAFYSEERPVMADLIVDEVAETEIARYYGGKYRKSVLMEGAYEAEDFFPNLGEGGKWLFFTASPLRDHQENVVGAIDHDHGKIKIVVTSGYSPSDKEKETLAAGAAGFISKPYLLVDILEKVRRTLDKEEVYEYKREEEKMKKTLADLKHSNAELEQYSLTRTASA